MAEQGRLAGGCGNNRGTYKHTTTRSIHEVKDELSFSFEFHVFFYQSLLFLLVNSHCSAFCVNLYSTEVSPGVALPGEMLRMMYAMAIMR